MTKTHDPTDWSLPRGWAAALALAALLAAPGGLVAADTPQESDPPAKHAFSESYAGGGAVHAMGTDVNVQTGTDAGLDGRGCLFVGRSNEACPMIGIAVCGPSGLVGTSSFTSGTGTDVAIPATTAAATPGSVGGACAAQQLVRTGDTLTIDASDTASGGNVAFGVCVDGNGDGLCRPEGQLSVGDSWVMRHCGDEEALAFRHTGATGFLYVFLFQEATLVKDSSVAQGPCVPTAGAVWGVVDTSTSSLPECADGRDNDGDGTVDFGNDRGCRSGADLDERGEEPTPLPPPSRCLRFQAAPSASYAEHLVIGTCGGIDLPECMDGYNNDRGDDGYDDGADFPSDPDCETPLDDRERGPACSDHIDNDGDGASHTDYPNDPGCDSPQDDDEYNPWVCSDGIDNDGDGRADYPEDPGCDGPYDDDQDEYNVWPCSDGIDNDGDGRTDYPSDPGCTGPYDADEYNVWPCSDGIDNDGDGRTDYPGDPGCTGPYDDSEYNVWACSDGLDNDGDGRRDYPNDPGCSGPYDGDEWNPYACSDGFDNDGDRLRDYPNDPGCSSPYDNDEWNPTRAPGN